MLKINKKLKKKKHKKGKDEELFTQEELEQYKKKLADKARLEEAAAQGASGSAPSETVEEIPDEDFDPRAVEEKPEAEKHENKDEWDKFKALTAGVDDILTSSKGKLEEIKKESFYQRKPPGPSEPDRKKPPPRPEAPKLPPRPPPPQTREPSPEEILQFPVPEDSEEEDEDEEDIFDTAYIDAVASGQIKLAYIPDSPPPEPDDDPFDTSIVDKVIKPKEIVTKDGKKKTLVSLGCAVDVLTGILDKEATKGVVQSGSIKKRRVQPRDLLLEGEGIIIPSEDLPYQPAPKTLLDEEAPDGLGEDFATVPVSVVAVSPAKKEVKEDTASKEDNSHLLSLVAEFDVISSSPVEEQKSQIEEDDDEDDEFAALAAESLIKNADPFDTSAVDKVIGVDKRPPGSPDVDIILYECPEDPFDTTHAENLAPGKLELQIIESEILGEVRAQSDIEDEDFDPRADETKTSSVTIHVSEPTEPPREDFDFPEQLTEEKRDLLGGSSSDLANLVHDPIEPKLGETEDEVDPFDTSAVVALVPGKLELQILEQELLDEDEEFDPRARDDLLDQRKLEVDIGVIAKPLTPQPEQEVPEEDPFDTSFAANLGPGKAELRFIESEFGNSEVPQQSQFEPPVCQPQHQIVQRPDLLEVTESDDQAPHKPLTPALETAAQPLALPDDPFDTSQVSPALAPGPAELRQLESELRLDEPSQALKPSYSDEDFNPRDVPDVDLKEEAAKESITLERPDLLHLPEEAAGEAPHKPLSPQQGGDGDDVDPFDTSFAGALLPGKAELKLLEEELIG